MTTATRPYKNGHGATCRRLNGSVFLMEHGSGPSRRYTINHQVGDGGWQSRHHYRRAEARVAAAMLAEYLGAELEP